MIRTYTVHSSVRRYRMSTPFGIADHEIGRLSQRRGTVRLVHMCKLIRIGRPGLAVLAQTVLPGRRYMEKSRYKAGLTLQCIFVRSVGGLS